MDIRFPIKGKHVGFPTDKQPPLTSPELNNVRPFHNGRLSGGQRGGMKKLYSQQIGGAAAPIVWMGSITTVD